MSGIRRARRRRAAGELRKYSRRMSLSGRHSIKEQRWVEFPKWISFVSAASTQSLRLMIEILNVECHAQNNQAEWILLASRLAKRSQNWCFFLSAFGGGGEGERESHNQDRFMKENGNEEENKRRRKENTNSLRRGDMVRGCMRPEGLSYDSFGQDDHLERIAELNSETPQLCIPKIRHTWAKLRLWME